MYHNPASRHPPRPPTRPPTHAIRPPSQPPTHTSHPFTHPPTQAIRPSPYVIHSTNPSTRHQAQEPKTLSPFTQPHPERTVNVQVNSQGLRDPGEKMINATSRNRAVTRHAIKGKVRKISAAARRHLMYAPRHILGGIGTCGSTPGRRPTLSSAFRDKHFIY